MFGFSTMDLAAVGVFLIIWVGYTLYADKAARTGKNLMTVMHAHRLRWMRRMLERENRMQDVQSLATQMRSVSLFASTTIFILGGLVALFGAIDQMRRVLSDIPFAEPTPPGVLEIKLFGLIVIFVYAFFKFAWSLRQFNYGLSLIGSAPDPTEARAPDRHFHAERMARIATLAVASFNRGGAGLLFRPGRAALVRKSGLVHGGDGVRGIGGLPARVPFVYLGNPHRPDVGHTAKQVTLTRRPAQTAAPRNSRRRHEFGR